MHLGGTTQTRVGIQATYPFYIVFLQVSATTCRYELVSLLIKQWSLNLINSFHVVICTPSINPCMLDIDHSQCTVCWKCRSCLSHHSRTQKVMVTIYILITQEFLGIHSSVQGLIKNLPSKDTRQPRHNPWNSIFTIKRTENYANA